MTESTEHPDRIVFLPYSAEEVDKQAKWRVWYRLAGGAFFALGVFSLVLRPTPMAVYFAVMGIGWWFMPQLQGWERARHMYVDRTQVSWIRHFRRHSVLLSDIASVSTDSKDPRWATHVILTLTDGRTRELPTTTPVRLLEVIESRVEGCSPPV